MATSWPSSRARAVQSAARPVSRRLGQTAGQVTAVGGGGQKQDLGLIFLDQLLQHLAVGAGVVVLQVLIVADIDLIRTIGKGFLGLDLMAHQDGTHLTGQLVGQLSGSAEHLIGDAGNLSAGLLQADPYAILVRHIMLLPSIR